MVEPSNHSILRGGIEENSRIVLRAELFSNVVDEGSRPSGEFASVFEDHSCNDRRQQRAVVELSPALLSGFHELNGHCQASRPLTVGWFEAKMPSTMLACCGWLVSASGPVRMVSTLNSVAASRTPVSTTFQ